jgi:hypothetical protein
MTYHYRSTTYEITVLRHAASGPMLLELDGQPVDDDFVRLADDGNTHHLTVGIAQRSTVTGDVIRQPWRSEMSPTNGMTPPNGKVNKIPLTSGD